LPVENAGTGIFETKRRSMEHGTLVAADTRGSQTSPLVAHSHSRETGETFAIVPRRRRSILRYSENTFEHSIQAGDGGKDQRSTATVSLFVSSSHIASRVDDAWESEVCSVPSQLNPSILGSPGPPMNVVSLLNG
jgi:hypothetical protein